MADSTTTPSQGSMEALRGYLDASPHLVYLFHDYYMHTLVKRELLERKPCIAISNEYVEGSYKTVSIKSVSPHDILQTVCTTVLVISAHNPGINNEKVEYLWLPV